MMVTTIVWIVFTYLQQEKNSSRLKTYEKTTIFTTW